MEGTCAGKFRPNRDNDRTFVLANCLESEGNILEPNYFELRPDWLRYVGPFSPWCPGSRVISLSRS
jgi:hypothetical protein